MKPKPSLRKGLFLRIFVVLFASITLVAIASEITDIYGHTGRSLSLYAFLFLLIVCGNAFYAKWFSDHLTDAIKPFLGLFNTPKKDKPFIEPNKQHYAEFVELAEAANETVKKKKIAEEKYREIVEGTDNLVTEVDTEGNFTFVNETSRKVFGLPPEECIGRKAFDFIHPDDRADTLAYFERWVKEKKSSVTHENRQVSQSGDICDMLWTINFHFDADGEISSIKSIARDITKLKNQEKELKLYRDQLENKVEQRTEELRKANIELREHAESQKVLLQEMNHRVKNNLTAIIGMLQLEQNKLKSKKMFLYQPSLQDLIGRIRGLATVHTLLSAAEWHPLKIEDLCRQVATATLQGLPLEKRIDVQISSSQARINSSQAHHLTMIIHELVTNAMKYALEGRQKAAISIEFEQQNNTTQIRFKDDGPGYHDDILQNSSVSSSTGFELIRGITSHSLRGDVSFSNQNGAVATIIFKNEIEHPKEELVQ